MPLGQKALHVHSVQCCKQEYEVRYIRIYFVELSYSFMPGKIQNPSLLGKLLLSLPVLSAKLGIYKSYDLYIANFADKTGKDNNTVKGQQLKSPQGPFTLRADAWVSLSARTRVFARNVNDPSHSTQVCGNILAWFFAWQCSYLLLRFCRLAEGDCSVRRGTNSAAELLMINDCRVLDCIAID